MSFTRYSVGEDGEETSKTVTRTLFQRSNAYPQKKVLTFNRYSDDFAFSVFYGDLDFLSPEEKRWALTGVMAARQLSSPAPVASFLISAAIFVVYVKETSCQWLAVVTGNETVAVVVNQGPRDKLTLEYERK